MNITLSGTKFDAVAAIAFRTEYRESLSKEGEKVALAKMAKNYNLAVSQVEFLLFEVERLEFEG